MQVLHHNKDGLMCGTDEDEPDQRIDRQLPLAFRRHIELRYRSSNRTPNSGQHRRHAREVETVLGQQAVDLVEALVGSGFRPNSNTRSNAG